MVSPRPIPKPFPTLTASAPPVHRARTLFGLILSLATLAILIGVAMPSRRAAVTRELADVDAIDTISTSLKLAYMDHRATDSPPRRWIDDIGDIAPILHHGRLPEGIAVTFHKLVDRRGNLYTFTPETMGSAAMITRDP